MLTVYSLILLHSTVLNDVHPTGGVVPGDFLNSEEILPSNP